MKVAPKKDTLTHHICANSTNLQKFETVGQHGLMCLNFEGVVKNFKQQTSIISQDFVTEFNLSLIIDVMHKTNQKFIINKKL